MAESLAEKTWAWDIFLEEDDLARPAIEAFREFHWPTIRRELREHLPEGKCLAVGQEPNWAEPGVARFWHQGINLRGDVVSDWAPTLPQPANNPNAIARQLKKGFRLRPDAEALVDVETSEAAGPAGGDEPTGPRYACARHSKGTVVFPTWSAYREHCMDMDEPIELPVPDEVLERLKTLDTEFYCAIHDRDFVNTRAASGHVSAYQNPNGLNRGLRFHPTMEQMRIIRDGKGNDADESRAGGGKPVAKAAGGGKPLAEGATGGAKGGYRGGGKAR